MEADVKKYFKLDNNRMLISRAQVVAMHGGSAGSFHSGSVAMPGVIRNPNATPDSYSMGAVQPPTQVTTRNNLSYGGKPLVSELCAPVLICFFNWLLITLIHV